MLNNNDNFQAKAEFSREVISNGSAEPLHSLKNNKNSEDIKFFSLDNTTFSEGRAANKFTYWNEIWEDNIDINNNRSIVHCRVWLKANGIGWVTNKSFGGSVNIGGNVKSYSFSPGNNFPYGSQNQVAIAEHSAWITHNENGGGSITVFSDYNASGSYSPGYCSASNNVNLQTILRKPVLRVDNVYNIDVNSAVFHYAIDRGVNFAHLFYRLNEQSEIQAYGNDIRISELNPNTEYRLQIRGKNSDMSIIGDWSGSYIFRTNDISKITNCVDFTLEKENPRMEFTKPNNSVVNVWLEKNSSVSLVNKKENANSPIEFALSASEIDKIYKEYSNVTENKFNYIAETVCNGKKYYDKIEKKITFVNVNPVFTNFETKNIDPITNEKIGTDRYINTKSTLEIKIANSNLAVGQKYAKIKEYLIYNGNITKKLDVNGGSVTFENVSSPEIIVTVVDTRGNKTSVSKNIKILPYKQPTISTLVMERENFVGERVYIELIGTYTNNFEEVVNDIDFLFKLEKEDDSKYLQIDGLFVFSDGSIKNKENSIIPGKTFPMEEEIICNLKIKDLFSEQILTVKINSGKVILTASKGHGVAVNSIYNDFLKDGLQVGGSLYLNGSELKAIDYDVISTW